MRCGIFYEMWNILWDVEYFMRCGIFYDHLLHFVFTWYIFTVLVSCTKKNLATLIRRTWLGVIKVQRGSEFWMFFQGLILCLSFIFCLVVI
jgi:hypothetical protein